MAKKPKKQTITAAELPKLMYSDFKLKMAALDLNELEALRELAAVCAAVCRNNGDDHAFEAWKKEVDMVGDKIKVRKRHEEQWSIARERNG